MNITPLEIRQKEFEKAFRGYDKDEVSAFLNSLSIEWERLYDQNKELKYKLESAENEVKKLREVENSLFKTLKTAEDTGANMVEQATKTAELHMKETEMRADALMSEAKSRARSIIEDAENKSRVIIDDMEDEIRQLEQVFRSMNASKDSLMSDLKILAEDILGKIERHQDFPSDIKPHLKKAKELGREVNDNTSKPVDVESILAENEQKAAEQSIDEMVDASEEVNTEAIEETAPAEMVDPVVEEVKEEPIPEVETPVVNETLVEETQEEPVAEYAEEVPEVESASEEETSKEEDPTEATVEEDKGDGSFFDKFE